MPLKFAKPSSHAEEKLKKQRAAAAYQQLIYRDVSIRDGRRCRCCKSRKALHHHHLVPRSMGGRDSTMNVCLLCAVCHADRHAYRLHIHGTNADGVLSFRRGAGQ